MCNCFYNKWNNRVEACLAGTWHLNTAKGSCVCIFSAKFLTYQCLVTAECIHRDGTGLKLTRSVSDETDKWCGVSGRSTVPTATTVTFTQKTRVCVSYGTKLRQLFPESSPAAFVLKVMNWNKACGARSSLSGQRAGWVMSLAPTRVMEVGIGS